MNNGVDSRKVLEYQQKAIEYFVAKCRNQHGMILNHSLASGKTLTGLYLFQNYPNHKKIVILPDGLQSHWVKEAKLLGIDYSGITFISFSLLEQFKRYRTHFIALFKDAIVIVDECHNLYKIIKKIQASKLSKEFDMYFENVIEDFLYKKNEDNRKGSSAKSSKNSSVKNSSKSNGSVKSRSSKKIGGNKIQGSPKDVDPDTNNSDSHRRSMSFEEDFVNPALVDFIDAFNSTHKLLLISGTIITNNIFDIRWLINLAAGRDIVPFNETQFKQKYMVKSKLDSFIFEWIKPLYLNIPVVRESLISKNLKKYVFTKNVTHFMDFVLSSISSAIFTRFLINSYETNLVRDLRAAKTKKEALVLFYNNNKNISLMFLMTLLIHGTRLAVSFIHSLYSTSFDHTELNAVKLRESGVYKYVSFYRVSTDINYPKVTHHSKSVVYTEPQTRLWVKLLNIKYTPLSSLETVQLELHANMKEAMLFNPDHIGKNTYIKKGRAIGNLYNAPKKFVEILKLYLSALEHGKKISTVVYSTFYKSGIKLFAKYLKESNVKYTLLTPGVSIDERNEILNDFKNKKITMLLLHPYFIEGLDLKGTRVFHILEPVIDYYQREQLYARVSRLHSHSHLPTSERNVKIYSWKCSILFDPNKFKHLKSSLSVWFEHNQFYFNYLNHLSEFSAFLSPDDQAIRATDSYAAIVKSLDQVLAVNNINNSTIPNKCEVFKDPGSGKIHKFTKLPMCYEVTK